MILVPVWVAEATSPECKKKKKKKENSWDLKIFVMQKQKNS